MTKHTASAILPDGTYFDHSAFLAHAERIKQELRPRGMLSPAPGAVTAPPKSDFTVHVMPNGKQIGLEYRENGSKTPDLYMWVPLVI